SALAPTDSVARSAWQCFGNGWTLQHFLIPPRERRPTVTPLLMPEPEIMIAKRAGDRNRSDIERLPISVRLSLHFIQAVLDPEAQPFHPARRALPFREETVDAPLQRVVHHPVRHRVERQDAPAFRPCGRKQLRPLANAVEIFTDHNGIIDQIAIV